MATDIIGKWQKRNKDCEKWQDIDGNFAWFNGYRNRNLFDFLYIHRNPPTAEIEKELMKVLCDLEDLDVHYLQKSIEELDSEEGYSFFGAGFLGLDEIKSLIGDEVSSDVEESLKSFIKEIEIYEKGDKESEYRVIFMFEN